MDALRAHVNAKGHIDSPSSSSSRGIVKLDVRFQFEVALPSGDVEQEALARFKENLSVLQMIGISNGAGPGCLFFTSLSRQVLNIEYP